MQRAELFDCQSLLSFETFHSKDFFVGPVSWKRMLLGLHYVISRLPTGEDDPVFLIVEGYREVVWMPLLPDFA